MENISLNKDEQILCEAKPFKPLKGLLIGGVITIIAGLILLIPTMILNVDDIGSSKSIPVLAVYGGIIVVGTILIIVYFKGLVISKNAPLIITCERVFIYKKRKYLDFCFENIVRWKLSESSSHHIKYGFHSMKSKFIFETPAGSYKVKGIKNGEEISKRLKEKCPEKYENINNDKLKKILNKTLLEDEKIICASDSKINFVSLGISIPLTALGIFIILIPFLPFGLEMNAGAIAFLAVVFVCCGGLGIALLIAFIRSCMVNKNIQIILTGNRIFVYDKKIRDYKGINLTDILSYETRVVLRTEVGGSENAYGKVTYYEKFILKTLTETFVTGKITNGFEIKNAIKNTIQNLKRQNSNKPILKQIQSIKTTEKAFKSNILLENNEKIICESESKRSNAALIPMLVFLILLPFFGLGVYCLIYYLKHFKNKIGWLVITSKRVFIYDRKLSDYNIISFNDILNWQFNLPRTLGSMYAHEVPKTNIKGVFGKFTFNTALKSYIASGVSNYTEMYSSLSQIMPNKYIKATSKIYEKYKYLTSDNYINTKAHIGDILKSDFFEYAIEEDVGMQVLNPSSLGIGYRLYDYILYKGGNAKAAIMISEYSWDKDEDFIGLKKICLKANIPFINFYTHFPNDREYVVNRIKTFLKQK